MVQSYAEVEKSPSGHGKDFTGTNGARSTSKAHVGVDLHKDFLQAAVMDDVVGSSAASG